VEVLQPVGGILAAKMKKSYHLGLILKEKYEEMTKRI
jgi:hypothetical protein